MIDDDIQKYGSSLFCRCDSGQIVDKLTVEIGDGYPKIKQCHKNVFLYCQKNPTCRPIHGWLFLKIGYPYSHVKFLAHSVIQLENGNLRDITPGQTLEQWKFIRAEESENAYINLIERNKIENLVYIESTREVIQNG